MVTYSWDEFNSLQEEIFRANKFFDLTNGRSFKGRYTEAQEKSYKNKVLNGDDKINSLIARGIQVNLKRIHGV